MRVTISGEIDGSFGLGEVVTDLSGPTKRNFQERHYGSGIEALVIILVCHELSSSLKRRMRFTKKNKLLGFDIMLDYDEMKRLDQAARKQKVIGQILTEMPKILKKYAISDFDEQRFVEDFARWLKSQQLDND
jgi:hypothetical protein